MVDRSAAHGTCCDWKIWEEPLDWNFFSYAVIESVIGNADDEEVPTVRHDVLLILGRDDLCVRGSHQGNAE
jgi:hypothetical protein